MESVRERLERDEERLSPLAARARTSKGREMPEDECPWRLPFQRDRDRILHCKAFRRLKHKTQVFVAPAEDHFRTRLTHTLEVAQIARTIARALWLNEDLTEAIALGHDLGHTPFGHAGEDALNSLVPGGFRHNEQSLRVVEVLEKGGRGLNLTWEVRDGILYHSKVRASIAADEGGVASTLEGQIVQVADSVAYINHDLEDAVRAGVIAESDVPQQIIGALGASGRDRINTMVVDIICNCQCIADGQLPERCSRGDLTIRPSDQMLALMDALREFLFQKVYLSGYALNQAVRGGYLVRALFDHYVKHPAELPKELADRLEDEPVERLVADYIASMTDRYALKLFRELFLPEGKGPNTPFLSKEGARGMVHMQSIVEEIKARLDIADIISERVQLKKAGKSLKGLCPFHVERTPSFIVFPETGTWHCFGCGEGGDIFGFVMRSQNVDFGEALSILAARAGVELHQISQEERRTDEGNERLYAVNESAAAYFRLILASPAGTNAMEYLRGRKISAESIEAFELGFAADSGAALAHHLLQQGFGREDILRSGLAGESESGALYDRFRARVIFPIRNASGKLVGFGGRSLSQQVQPKYLNTPQTAIFDKGGCLYLIDKARQEIKRTGRAVIVEGYIDALMAHQHGFRNVVASLGTAVTERQISQLKRLAAELCFALDPDTAGQEATARGLVVAMDALDHDTIPVPNWKGFVEYAYRLKTAIKIISLPEGHDPDELIRESGSEWERLVNEAVPVQDFFIERVRRKYDLSTASGKSAAVEEAMGVIAIIPEPVQQAHYVQRLATMVGVPEAILLQQVRRGRRRGDATIPSAPTTAEPSLDVEAYCLALLLREPALIDHEPRLQAEDFSNPIYQEIFRKVVQCRTCDRDKFVEMVKGSLVEALQDGLDGLLLLQHRHPVLFQGQLESAYKSAAVNLLLRGLSLRKQELEALRFEGDAKADPEETIKVAKMEQQIAREIHRLKLLGCTLPLRAIHKEVQHGG